MESLRCSVDLSAQALGEVNREALLMPTWIQLIQHGLSLAGLIAIMAWTYKWISRFAHKQRELSDIDREIREALREALDTQKELRTADRSAYEVQLGALRDRAQEATASAATKTQQLDRYERLLHVIHLGTRLSRAMAKERSEELLGESIQLMMNSSKFLAEHLDVSAENFRNALGAESVPDKFPDRLFYFGMKQIGISTSLRTAAKISSAVVPTLLEEFAKNPDASDQDLRDNLNSRIREGKLDEF